MRIIYAVTDEEASAFTMISEQIQTLLQGKQIDPLNGHPIRIPIDTINLGAGLVQDACALVAPLSLGSRLAVVSDSVTQFVLGESLAQQLKAAHIVLKGSVLPDEARVAEVRDACRDEDAIIAAGSGTINDICKYASFLDSKPYIVFATALSMNGYTSANASIIDATGEKKSCAAHLPKAVFLDTHILASAPRRLTQAGLGDTLCRSTAQADWLMSHLLLGTPYNPLPFAWLEAEEEGLIARAKWLTDIKTPELQQKAITTLAQSLLLGGLGMVVCGGSYPASQAEHMIAHLMEQRYGKSGKPSFHGEQIAVTTLTMARLQEKILNDPNPPRAVPMDIYDSEMMDYFGNDAAERYLSQIQSKLIDSKEKAEALNERLENDWNRLRINMLSYIVPAKTIENALKLAGAPTKPEDIGWDRNVYASAVKYALFTRDRFTFLDLAHLTGTLKSLILTI